MPDPSQVLVVDEHPGMVALIKRWLVRASDAVIGVTTVQKALEALSAHAFLSKPFSGEALLAILTQAPSSAPTRPAPGGAEHGPAPCIRSRFTVARHRWRPSFNRAIMK